MASALLGNDHGFGGRGAERHLGCAPGEVLGSGRGGQSVGAERASVAQS